MYVWLEPKYLIHISMGMFAFGLVLKPILLDLQTEIDVRYRLVDKTGAQDVDF